MPVGRSSPNRSGGSAGRSARGGRRIQRNAGPPRPRVLTNNTLAMLDAELHEVNESTEDQLLGCPFYKNDPLRHRACMTLRLTSINYVKQHLHRCHVLPRYCPTCYDTFKDIEAYDQHIVDRTCNGPPPGVQRPVGVDSAQRSALAQRVGRTLSRKAQWLEVYHILFGQDALRPVSIFIGDPIMEVSAIIRDIWKSNDSAIITEALAKTIPGIEAHTFMAHATVEGLLERTLTLASQPSSQETAVAAITFSRSTTALDSQVGGDAPSIKAEPGLADHARPVHLDPELFTPTRNNNKSAHDKNVEVDNGYFGMAVVAAATYNNTETATPTNYAAAAATYTAYTADPMAIDPTRSVPNDDFFTPLVTSPSPEPEPAGPSKWPRRKRKAPNSISTSSRSGSLESTMTLDSPTYGCGWGMVP